MEYNGISLVCSCGACPEQYDAYRDGELVGYLRLRHGYFYASCPDVGGKVVYNAYPRGDGIFDIDEREGHLLAALKAIDEWIASQTLTFEVVVTEEHLSDIDIGEEQLKIVETTDGGAVIVFSEEMINKLGWSIGDTIVWSLQPGKVSITKKIE